MRFFMPRRWKRGHMYKQNTHTLVLTALLAVLSLILSLVKMAVPFIPPFLTLDLSFIPLFIGILILNYKHALIISLLKNVLHFALISHEPTGSIANLVVEFIFLSSLAYFCKKNDSKFSVIVAGLIGTVLMAIFMAFLNYFILLPMYGFIIDLKDITNNLKAIVTYGIIPFNIIKGLFLIVLYFITKAILKKIPNSLIGKFKI